MEKVQVIKCKCGAVFAACMEPHCYTETEWMRDLRKYVKQGCTVDVIYNDSTKSLFGKCTCDKKKDDKNEPTLF